MPTIHASVPVMLTARSVDVGKPATAVIAPALERYTVPCSPTRYVRPGAVATPVRSFEKFMIGVRPSICPGEMVRTSPSAPTATAGPPGVPVTARRFSASAFGMTLYFTIDGPQSDGPGHVPTTTVPKEPTATTRCVLSAHT